MKLLPTAPQFTNRVRAAIGAMTLFLGLTGGLTAQTQDTGSITGRVRNQASGAALPGASVTIAGTERYFTLTSDDGSFRLNHIPVGNRTVVVNYTGLNTGNIPVTVVANDSVNVDVELTSEIYTMEKFQVSTVREGQAAALNEQKNADNIIAVVSTDAFGNVADTNVGNMLIKLSGISPERDEAEVYKVSVRGINADLNSVSLDGTLLASASSRGTGRGFEVDKISTNSIESIEVIKAPTPDMDADAIGGKINFKTKNGFDFPNRRIRYSLGSNIFLQDYVSGSDGTRRGGGGFFEFGRFEANPSASISYSEVLGAEKRWAVTFNGSFNRTFSPRTMARLDYIDDSLNSEVPLIKQFQTSEDDITLDRLGVGGKIHFKLSSSTTLFFNFLYNDFNDEMTQHKFIFGNNGTNRVGTDTYEKQTFRDRLDYELEARTRTAETSMFQIGGRTQKGDWDIDYDFSTSSSYATDKRVIMLMRFSNITYELDRTNSIYFPSITQTAGADIGDYKNGSLNNLDRRWDQNWDDVNAGKLNVKRSFNTRYPSNLKAGLRYRHQERTQDRARPRFNAINSAIGDLNRFRSDERTVFPLEGRYQRWPWPDVRAIHNEIDEHPEMFTENVGRGIDQDLANDLTAGEKIYATYLMGTVKTGGLTTVAGARVERTETYGTNVKINELFDSGDPRRYEEKQSSKGSYENFFPGLHFRYAITPNLNARASFSTGIGRPNFTRLMPNIRVRDLRDGEEDDDDDNSDLPRIEMNNPNLKPQFSDNIDLVLEYYFKNVGTISVGVFRKELDGFIFTNQRTIVPNDPVVSPIFGDLYADGTWKLRYPVNGGWARVDGLELNYNQQLTFLPGFLNGFGVYANATFLKTRGTYENEIVMDDISGFTKRSGNAGLTYIKHGYTVRLSANYNGARLDGYDEEPMKRTYQGARTSVDFSVKYNLPRRKTSLFFDINNITNSKRTRYQANESLQRETQVYGMRITAGIQGEF
jgi:iron complex outermembrane receptor protein